LVEKKLLVEKLSLATSF